MATETTKVVIETEVNGTTKVLNTFKDFKDAMSALKKEQEGLTIGSDAWKKNQQEIEKLANTLKELSKTESQRNKENEKAAKDQEKALRDQENAYKRLKKELKEQQALALNGDGKAAKRVAELKDQIEDLADVTKSKMGTSVERGNVAVSNLSEGFKNLDLDKIKLGFKGLGTAIAATGIGLLVQGITYLISNFDELSKGSGVLAKSLQWVGDQIDTIKKGLDFLTDSLGITNSALEKQGEALKGFAEKTNEALSETSAAYDRQIRVARANGKSTVELEIAKQQAIIDTNVVIAKQIEAFVRAGGELDAEKRKLLTASLDAIKNAKVTELEIETTHTQKLNDEYKKRQQKLTDSKKESDALFEQLSKEQDAKQQKEADDKLKQKEKEQAEADKLEAERAALNKQMRDKENADQIAANQKVVDSLIKAEQDKQAAIDASFQHAQLVTQNLQAISDLTFSLRASKLKKGSAEEEALMKRQFEVNKKLQVAQTVVSTITGAREAYKSLAGIPIVGVGLGIAAAAAATIAGLGAIAKINNTKFESSSAPSVDSGSGSSFSSSSNAPSTNSSAPSIQPFTRLNEDGSVQNNQPVVKAYVVESEMTDKQKRVGRLQDQSTFG